MPPALSTPPCFLLSTGLITIWYKYSSVNYFIYCSLHSLEREPQEGRDLHRFCSLIYPRFLEQWHEHRRCFLNICELNLWMSVMRGSPRIKFSCSEILIPVICFFCSLISYLSITYLPGAKHFATCWRYSGEWQLVWVRGWPVLVGFGLWSFKRMSSNKSLKGCSLELPPTFSVPLGTRLGLHFLLLYCEAQPCDWLWSVKWDYKKCEHLTGRGFRSQWVTCRLFPSVKVNCTGPGPWGRSVWNRVHQTHKGHVSCIINRHLLCQTTEISGLLVTEHNLAYPD